MPPQTNGTLTRVGSTAAGESFDGPAGAGPEVWAGREPVYLRERRDRRREGAAGDIIIDRLLIVDADVAVDWRVGYRVDFERDGAAEHGTVQRIERPTIDDPDIPADLQTVRLTLDPR